MFIEQIRYYVNEENRDAFVTARREIDDLRRTHGIPPGDIMVADVEADDGPSVVWQCGYENEEVMSGLTTRLMGNEAYEAARERLASLMERAEIEMYTLEEMQDTSGVTLDQDA
ncbi:MAG TPA: hypothetical protein VF898_13060 [Chloroflexota bacterium]